MALVRWEPVRELNTIQGEINRLFNSFFDTPVSAGEGAGRRWLPAMDLVEADDHYVLRADLPGLSEDDVKIEVEDNVLTVSGERKAQHEQRGEGYHRLERSYGSFSRALTLPEGVDPEAVQASFDRGVLEVRIPKPEERKPRRVSISVGGGNGSAAGESVTIEGSESAGAPTDPTAPEHQPDS
jgi:HSP20 family protein